MRAPLTNFGTGGARGTAGTGPHVNGRNPMKASVDPARVPYPMHRHPGPRTRTGRPASHCSDAGLTPGRPIPQMRPGWVARPSLPRGTGRHTSVGDGARHAGPRNPRAQAIHRASSSSTSGRRVSRPVVPAARTHT